MALARTKARSEIDAGDSRQLEIERSEEAGALGQYGSLFDISEPEAYRWDAPQAEAHVLDAGHFKLDTAADQIAKPARGFLSDERVSPVCQIPRLTSQVKVVRRCLAAKKKASRDRIAHQAGVEKANTYSRSGNYRDGGFYRVGS